MKAIRALVVDDEPLSRANLLALLARHPEIEVVGESGSGKQCVADVNRLTPDLLFLDVEMPDGDGFAALERLGTQIPPAIIFVTAYDRYALSAFDAGALDYLLKPFDDARFERALSRAKERIAARDGGPEASGMLAIRGTRGVVFVRVAEIDWIESADYYSRLHVDGKTHLLRRSMADLENELSPSAFCRIHRSTIVNLERVRELTADANGDYEVRLVDGSTHRLSRRFRREFQSRLAAMTTLRSVFEPQSTT